MASVPAPRAVLGPDEVVSVRHLRRHLGAHDIYLVAPEGVEPAVAELPVQRFHPRFFRSLPFFSHPLDHGNEDVFQRVWLLASLRYINPLARQLVRDVSNSGSSIFVDNDMQAIAEQ